MKKLLLTVFVMAMPFTAFAKHSEPAAPQYSVGQKMSCGLTYTKEMERNDQRSNFRNVAQASSVQVSHATSKNSVRLEN